MNILKFRTSLVVLIVALTGFILINGRLLRSEQANRATESKVEQAPPGEETNYTPIKTQYKSWYEKISKNETKHFELNLLFPDEGKFFIEATALAYDRELKVWKILGEYYVYVTTKPGEEGKVEKSSTGPKVTPYKIKAEGPDTVSLHELLKKDTLKDKTADVKPKAIPNPKRAWRLKKSIQAGEALLELLISFDPNPKINEPTKLLLSVSSTVPRDSVHIDLIFPESIKVLK